MLRALAGRHLAIGGRCAAAALGSSGGGGGWAAGGGAAAASALALRGLHSTSALLASLQVKIPALGESISDGTVSAVLKQPGERVEEDEPILQIETDKVTVDVRAPRAGVIEAILVKADDNVEVGHVVASIAEGATAGAAAPAPQPAAPAPQQQAAAPPPKRAAAAAAPPKPAAPKAVAPSAAATTPGAPGQRRPSISFPPRRTPQGELISALPPAQAKQLLASLLAPAKPAAQPVPPQYKHMIAVPIVGGSMPILRGMPVPSGAPGPPRRTMSDAEMEAIMLGGADDI